MKRLILCLSFLLTFAASSYSFDWPKQSNEELKRDLLLEAQGFLADYQNDMKLSSKLGTFISEIRNSPGSYDWIALTHNFVAQLRKLYPPKHDNAQIRERIFKLLDYPLHVNNHDSVSPDEKDAFFSSVRNYINSSLQSVSTELSRSKTKSGLDIFAIYDMGVVLRSKVHAVGIDISRNPRLPSSYPTHDDAVLQALVSELDILLLTHPHSDHYWPELMTAMAEAGKPVILPCSPERLGLDPKDGFIVMDKERDFYRSIGLDVHSFMGDQGKDIPCNVYVIDIDGIRVVHNGDNNSTQADLLVGEVLPVNLVIAASWNAPQDLLSIVMQQDENIPLLFIPLHLNELEHGVRNRESFRELYSRKDRLGNPDFKYPPYIVLDNGESYHYNL